ncbi:MAG TPA: sigma-70 family RNA polymerase sigma factor [Candidatus Eisenbacteria bacterium]|nr:sigma-70 family RNA polymerase sigma factor [Candidatus Eisenbacteria bacterium]
MTDSTSISLPRFGAVPAAHNRGSYAMEPTGPAILPDVSDEMLLVAVAAGDRSSLEILFRRYARLVHSIGKKILRDPAEAEDFVQELFLHVFRKAYLYDSSKGPARGWIVQTSYYEALHRRAQLITRPHYASATFDEMEADDILAPPIAGYDQSGEGLFGRVRWRELIECLTEDQWEVFRLHFYEGYTFEEIGQKRNLTVATVRHRYYRGLDRLRKHIFASESPDH